MSKKQIITLVLAITALTTDLAFAAGIPANVRQVSAEQQGTTVRVTWSPVEDAAFYRVYFSHESILENEGNYDDFERTSGSDAEYTFVKLPLKSDTITFGVLAVNADGQESEGFETEKTITVTSVETTMANDKTEPSTPEENMPEGENPTSTAKPMEIESVEAVSATGVLITFTKTINPDADIKPDFFILTDSGGNTLAVKDMQKEGAMVLLTTDMQAPKRAYTFGLLNVIPAEDGTNITSSAPQMSFEGFGDVMTQPTEPVPYGKPPTATTPPPVPYGKPPTATQQPVPYGKPPVGMLMDATFLDLAATPRTDGTYDVTARWNPANGAQAYGLYTAVQGMPYAWNGQVPANQTTVVYNKVKPGAFALRLTSKDANGQESRGIERAVNLPTTGLGLLGIMGVAGASAGMRLRRRRKTV